ncbi:MAG: Mu-like prophage major head subunit gpT family protein, partial [Hyphomonadaceae bacterium]|nr:Mu-like prophage major head subunit gpT family protein [Hyphomonadaceae bacterium]
DLLTENGEIKYTARTESKESIQLDTYARGVNYTMRAIINDDLGALTDATSQFGQKAAAKDAEVVMAVLNANAGAGPTMDDGNALFSVAHDNLDTAISLIAEYDVSQARLAMRSIVGLDGQTMLNIVPKYMVVSKELETTAEKFLATVNATTTSDVNPFAGKLSLIVEPRLPAYEWQMWADPALAPVLALARLAGREAPQIEQQQAWTTWGVSFRCIHHVGAAAVGWRGVYKFTNGEDSNSEV